MRELFDMLNGMRGQAMGQPGYGPTPRMAPPSSGKDTFVDRRYDGGTGFGGDIGQGIADAVAGLAGNMMARKIGKRMRRAYEERIGPAMQARANRSQRDWGQGDWGQGGPGQGDWGQGDSSQGEWDQSASDEAAIVQRYPELRGCLRDQVLFLPGGTEVVPLSDIRLPVTLDQADALVARLR